MKRLSDFQNIHSGPCYIIGCGPTLDEFSKVLPQDYPRIGINRATMVVRCEYGISTDHWRYLCGIRANFLATPYYYGMNQDEPRYARFDLHECIGFQHRPGENEVLKFSHKKIAEHAWLYTSTTSANPAIHLAWFMGFDRAFIVGIGEEGYSKLAEPLANIDNRKRVDTQQYWPCTESTLYHFFGYSWERWKP